MVLKSTHTESGGIPVVPALGLTCLAMLLLTGCSEKAGGTRYPNLAPDTFITSGPAEGTSTHYVVKAYWYGADRDGYVKGFGVCAMRDATRGLLGNVDYDTLAWALTTSKESTFVLPADSCCDPSGEVWYGVSLWGLLVRAIDNEGAIDPEPASLFFQAASQVPKVTITVPRRPVRPPPWYLPPSFYLEWEGEDPDGDVAGMSYKYLVIREADVAGGQWYPAPGTPQPWLPPLDHDSSGVDHGAPPVGYWSEWVPADCTYVTDLDLSSYSGTSEYLLIFVTARDEAGAVLPEELFGLAYNNGHNWRKFMVGGVGEGVPIVIDGGIMGNRSSTDPAEYETNIAYIFEGTEVGFTFWGLENPSSGQTAEAYRYYYDNPGDPETSTWDSWTPVDPIRHADRWPEWYVRFPADSVPLAPPVGPHVFVVELRDLSQTVTHCEFHLDVLESPRSRPKLIFLVDDDRDDGLEPIPPRREESEDSMWVEILDGYTWDYFDTGPDFEERVSARLVGQATTVIWAADQDLEENTQLLRLCAEYGNFLHSYVKSGGNLIIIGRDPIYAHAYWPDGLPNPAFRPNFHCLDFRPRFNADDSTWSYNFNWDVFGIEEMCVPTQPVSFTTMWPCTDGWDVVEADTARGRPYWDGVFHNAFFVTRVRSDINVQRLYGVVPLGDGGVPGEHDCTRWLAVYVPGDETRGHAAYVGFPPWLCDHDQVSVMVRHLLDSFGEP